MKRVYLHRIPDRVYTLSIHDGHVREVWLSEHNGTQDRRKIPFGDSFLMRDAYRSLLPEIERGVIRTLSGVELPAHATHDEHLDWICSALACASDEAEQELDTVFECDDWWMVRFRCGDWCTEWTSSRSLAEAARLAEDSLDASHSAVRQLAALVQGIPV